jgi:hypothetical protein
MSKWLRRSSNKGLDLSLSAIRSSVRITWMRIPSWALPERPDKVAVVLAEVVSGEGAAREEAADRRDSVCKLLLQAGCARRGE